MRAITTERNGISERTLAQFYLSDGQQQCHFRTTLWSLVLLEDDCPRNLGDFLASVER